MVSFPRHTAGVCGLGRLGGSLGIQWDEAEEATESLGRFPGAQVFWEVPSHGAGPLRLLVNDLQAKCVNLTGTQVTDAKLANLRLKAFHDLEMLNLWDTGITDAGLEHLKDLSYLQSLSLNDKQITDAGLMKLTVLRRLQKLDLAGTKVTDAGLETLTGLDQLRRLVLCGTKVTDAGMEWLERLPKLRTLYLDRTQITDAGLAHFAKIPASKFYLFNKPRLRMPA